MTPPQTSTLEHLERRTSLPGIAELLSGNSMPSESTSSESQAPRPAFTTEIPATLNAHYPPASTRQVPAPGALRDADSSAMNEPPVAMPAPVIAPSQKEPSFAQPIPDSEIDAATPPPIENKSGETKPVAAPHEALLPIVETSLEKALYASKTDLHMSLEPMLRATVRRAIAEQMQTMHHFGKISVFDRFAWRLKALFTSRTYDDIVFDHTHRYRVEEVYLLRYESNSLISYASHDPSRHSAPRKIKYDLSRLVDELKDQDGDLRKSFELPNRNTAVVRGGENCFLLACVRGPINALVRADLDYVLTQVEQRFGERLRDQEQHFVHVLQPLLEGCLLIQSPPAPR
jgi:hypothetical protein